MKENIFDVLMYLFENYVDDDNQLSHDQESLRVELVEAGFPNGEVDKAFTWLEGLAEQRGVHHHQGTASIRIYASQECEKIDVECQGFLLFLEQLGVLDVAGREVVIDRVMALETDEFGLEQLKWVVLMVLFNQPGQEAAFEWMENLVYNEMAGNLH